MAVVRSMLSSGRNVLRNILGQNQVALRGISISAVRQCSAKDDVEGGDKPSPAAQRLVVDPETSIRYMESKAYSEAYGEKPVWFHYRRNFKGQRAPKTRKTCIRKGQIDTGSPCPVCRDEYLVLDYRNVKLLEQFISPYTGEVLETKTTGICQKQHKKLMVEVLKAQNCGYLEKNVPFREYDYSQYWDATHVKVL